MPLYDQLIAKKVKLSVVGLGYVGMPIAVAFSSKLDVIGYDYDAAKIEMFLQGIDPTHELGDQAIKECAVDFTNDETRLKGAKFHIIAVPTPINSDKTPDLGPVESASKIVGRNLTPGSIVVYESTVYPGTTEDICVPILEKESGLICGSDFKVGYSPERINPGDKVHRLDTIMKIVSGMDSETLETIAKVYELIITAGVHRAETIRVAEAAKIIENCQRDINIAFMNELAMIFNKLGIDTKAVLRAAGTKWNFLKFTPGLVGGHCIGIDPYYLTYKAEQIGYHSQIIMAGRRINDGMGKYVAENVIKSLIKADICVQKAKVAILGITFKEGCPDVRNTRVMDIIHELRDYGIDPLVSDPIADCGYAEYGIELVDIGAIKDVDALIIAVAHEEFLRMQISDFESMFRAESSQQKVLIDVKGILDRNQVEGKNIIYWRL